LQELRTSTRIDTQELTGRTVTIFFEPYFITLAGRWHWDFISDSVFCSNVMLSLQQDLEATKGIIHPDDAEKVKTKLEADTIRHLEFRIITSYGEVITIAGEKLTVLSRIEFFDEAIKQVRELSQNAIDKKELQELQLFKEVHEKADRLTNTGIWWHNAATSETWYSAEVFRIYGLAPFSANSHLNTFLPFIHEEDMQTVQEYISQSYQHQTPLHIEYRIQTGAGEKYVQHISQWMYSANGEPVLSGMFKDITEEKKKEIQLDESEQQAHFFKQQLQFDEQNNATAHWYVNLITRKYVYSANYYRLFGLRGKTVIEASAFNDYIHPEDREAYRLATKKMLHQHEPPEIDFRIYRVDGKLRYFSQKAKLVPNGNDMVMMGTIEDVTVKTQLQNKIKELGEAQTVQSFAHRHVQEMSGTAAWVWSTIDNSIEWSENFYNFLGVKPGSKELTQKLFHGFVQPEDQKLFRDQMNLILHQKQESVFDFRLQLFGKTKYVTAAFRLMKQEEEEFFIAIFRDNTSKHLLTEELNERIQLAEALSQNTLDRIIITDVHHTIKIWNKACEEIYGMSIDEVLGKNFFDVFPKKKTEEEITLFNRVLKGERIFIKAYRSLSVHGYYDLHLLPAWDSEHNEVSGIIHIMHDVTQEMKLQQNLGERLRFIESLVDSSLDRIIAIDRNLNYLVWNKKAEEYYGLRKEHVVNKNVLEVFPNAQETPTYEQLRKALRGETISLSFGGENVLFKTVLIPIKNEKQEVAALLWMEHDLSKEIESERRLREQTQLLKTVFNASVDGIILFKAVRNDDGMITDYEVLMNNAVTQKWNGRSLVGKNYVEEFPSVKETGLLDAYNKVMETGEPVDTEIYYEGEQFRNWFRVTAVKLSDDELVATAEDITERKLASEKLNESKTFIEEITINTPDLITIHDINNNIVYANHNEFWKEVFDTDEVYKMKQEQRAEAMIAEEDLEKAKAFVKERRLLKDKEVKEVELKMKHGKWLRIRSKVFKRDANGDVQQIISFSTDITARKKAEDENKKQLALLRYTEYLAQSGTWEYEVSTGEFKWSEGMYRLFGLPQHMNIRPETYLDVVIEEDRSIAKKIVTNLKKNYQAFEEVIRIKRHGDEVRTIKIKASVISDENANVQRIIGVDIDITGIQKAEEELKESQHWLQETAIASPDSISVYDLQTKQPLYLNNCLSEWIGMSSDELTDLGNEGRIKLVHPDDRLKLLHFNSKMAEASDGDVITMEYRVSTKDNELIWLRNRTKVFQRDIEGNVTHVLTVLQNVTEEVNLRNELKRRIQFAETILDNSTNRITVFDRDYRFVIWNKRCEEIHGVAKDKVIGKTIFEMFPGIENYSEFINAQERSMKGEYVYVPAIQDGYTGAWLELFYVPLKNDAGETYAVVNVMHDVSKYVRNSEELDALNKKLAAKNRELEQKNEEITGFAFVASHDMKEPLRKIHTFSDWLIETERDWLSEQGKTILEKINGSVKRMEQLIDDILVLTKIHSDTHREEDVDLNEVLIRVKEEMKEKMQKTGTVIDSQKLPVIKGNRHQLFYLFENLVSNAIKFQKPGSVPQVTITSEIVKGGELQINEPCEEYMKLCFADNGFGFEQKYAKKIFQVFQRLHGKQEYGGTGIGLAICRKIMENHNGLINVTSEVGKGSVFNCFFPLH
jgi:PAS domain S-box-containing protein